MSINRDENIMELLAKSSLAKGLDKRALEDFLKSSKVKHKKYASGEIIFHEGDMPQNLYLLLEGQVSILKNTYLGRQLVLGEIKSGDIFGEVYLFLGHRAYDMYTMAVQDSAVLEISTSFFLDTAQLVLPLTIKIQQNLLRVIASKAYFMHNRLKILASGSLREKIARFLFQYADANGKCRIHGSREQMAAQLSVARPSLSRELGKMQQEGILSINGEEFAIKDLNAFEIYL